MSRYFEQAHRTFNGEAPTPAANDVATLVAIRVRVMAPSGSHASGFNTVGPINDRGLAIKPERPILPGGK